MADKADGSIVLAKLQVALLLECVFQILLQIGVRMSSMASPLAWTNYADMLSTPANFPIFSTLTAASASRVE